jgi:hypothetical protein
VVRLQNKYAEISHHTEPRTDRPFLGGFALVYGLVYGGRMLVSPSVFLRVFVLDKQIIVVGAVGLEPTLEKF